MFPAWFCRRLRPKELLPRQLVISLLKKKKKKPWLLGTAMPLTEGEGVPVRLSLAAFLWWLILVLSWFPGRARRGCLRLGACESAA